MHKDMYNDTKGVSALLPQVGKTTLTSAAIDLLGFQGALIQVHVGTTGDTLSSSTHFQAKVQESDSSNTGFADVASSNLQGSFTDINANTKDDVLEEVGYLGTKRYIKVIITFTGTHTNGTPVSAVVTKGLPELASTR